MLLLEIDVFTSRTISQHAVIFKNGVQHNLLTNGNQSLQMFNKIEMCSVTSIPIFVTGWAILTSQQELCT